MGRERNSLDIAWEGATAKSWNASYSEALYAPLQQSFAFGEVIRRHKGRVRRAVIARQGTPVALAQVAIRRLPGLQLATIIMGPLWLVPADTDMRADALKLLQRTCPVKGLTLLMAMPPEAEESAEQMLRLRRVVSPYHTILLDLRPDEETLRGALDGKWRNRLNVAERGELRVTPLGRRPEQYAWLLQREVEQRRARGYRALSPGLVPTLQELAGKESVLGVEAKLGGDRAGGMLFLRHGSTATYHIGWSSPDGREENASNLLLWQAIRLLKKKGVATLDLGGVDTDHAPGLAHFKLGLGGRPLSQSGTWLLRPKLF